MVSAMKNTPGLIVMLALCAFLCVSSLAQSIPILLERHGDNLIVSAPQLHFISGKAMERLKNGSTITYVVLLSIARENSKKQILQLRNKFMISYDLWEEKFSVIRVTDGNTTSRLTSAMAEAWCLGNIPIPARSVPEREPFMIRLECSIQEESEKQPSETSGQIFANLIEIFGRKKDDVPQRWETIAGPFRLENLKNSR
jgi:hypothetical protein